MSAVWPRLPMAASSQYMELVRGNEVPPPADSDPYEEYAPIGQRVRPAEVRAMRSTLTELASRYGYPTSQPSAADLRTFDRQAARVLVANMDLAWSEASVREMWTHLALVVLPHITAWRWGGRQGLNEERWVARDLTRHTWARLWWQATTFAGYMEVLDLLSESDLNQMLERRRIGGEPRLVVALSCAVLMASREDAVPRRHLLRDACKRLLRVLAYIDVSATTDEELDELATALVAESRRHLAGVDVSYLDEQPAEATRSA